jgi:predicted nucleotidyltransferase
MISEEDKRVILAHAKKYGAKKVVLFGSAERRMDARDIDIGVKGIAPEVFFDFCWEVCRDLSKPADIIDLSEDCLFNRLVERDGLVLYG